jgi:hypothetical protein
MVVSYGLEELGFESLQEQETYLFSKRPKPAVRTTLRPKQWGTEFFSPEQCGQDVMLTTHLHLVPKLRISGALLLLPLDVFIVCPYDVRRTRFAVEETAVS